MKTVFPYNVNILLSTSPPIRPVLDSGGTANLNQPFNSGYISEFLLDVQSAVNIDAQEANWLNLKAHSITLFSLYMPF